MKAISIGLLVCVGLVGAAAEAAVTVPNGDFETGTFSDWGTPTSAVTIVSDNGPSAPGSYAVHYQSGDWNNGMDQGNTKITKDQGLQPLTTYNASFDIKGVAGSTGALLVFFDTYPAGIYGGYGVSPLPALDTATLTPGVWQTLSWQFTTTTNISNEPGRAGFWVRTYGGGGSRDVYVDNFQINAVPEPASISLLALSGLAVLRRRRSA